MAKLNLFNQGEYGAADVNPNFPPYQVYKSPKAQSEALFNLGRKRYENFNPYPTSTPIDPNNPGGSPEVVGNDRIYALFQHALDNNLDFARVLYNDRERYPDRTPNTLVFANEKFELGKGHSGGDHWRKIQEGENPDPNYGEIKDGWRHISRGTNYGSDIYRLLAKENLL